MSVASATMGDGRVVSQAEERRVIFASSLGTVFEWYDFYIYGTLGAILAGKFFSGVAPTSAFIFTLLAFAAGFAVRPFGALVFGRLGDLVGRPPGVVQAERRCRQLLSRHRWRSSRRRSG